MKAQLARLARDWENVQTTETSAANQLSADWNGLNQLERNDTLQLHLGPAPQEPPKVPVLSPLFNPRPTKTAVRPAKPPAASAAPAVAAQPVADPAGATSFDSFLPTLASEVPFSIDALDGVSQPAAAAPAAAPPAQAAAPPAAPQADPVQPVLASAPGVPAPTSTQVAAALNAAPVANPAAAPAVQPNSAPAPADVMPEPGKEVQDLGMDARILEMARQAGLDLTP